MRDSKKCTSSEENPEDEVEVKDKENVKEDNETSEDKEIDTTPPAPYSHYLPA